MDWIYEPWPWYVSGPLIAGVMFLLLFMGKQFGISSNLRTLCSIAGANRITNFFKKDWKDQQWNLLVALGCLIGGFLASTWMANDAVKINPRVSEQLARDLHITSGGTAYLPPEIFSAERLSQPYYWMLLLVAGVLVGFGSRYAGGCTSGHAISGLSNLQWPSLVAVVGFFIGGLTMVYLLFPLIF